MSRTNERNMSKSELIRLLKNRSMQLGLLVQAVEAAGLVITATEDRIVLKSKSEGA